MEKRIQALEAKYKRLKSIYILSALSVVAMFVMGQTANQQTNKNKDIIADYVTAREYKLVDENGKVVGGWVGKSGGATFVINESKDNYIGMSVGIPGLGTRLSLISKDRWITMELDKDHDKTSSLLLHNNDKQVVVTASNFFSSGLQVRIKGKKSVLIGEGSSVPGNISDVMGFWIMDNNKKSRAYLGLDDDGASLTLSDSIGKQRAVLGKVTTVDKITDTTTETPEASLKLFNKDGKTIFQAP